MAIDFAPDGIRVNVICPGWIQIPLVEDWFWQQEDEAAAHKYIYGAAPSRPDRHYRGVWQSRSFSGL